MVLSSNPSTETQFGLFAIFLFWDETFLRARTQNFFGKKQLYINICIDCDLALGLDSQKNASFLNQNYYINLHSQDQNLQVPFI